MFLKGKVGQGWGLGWKNHLFTARWGYKSGRRKWQPTPMFLPGESQGQGEPGGLPSMGSHRVGRDWSDLAEGINLGSMLSFHWHWEGASVLPLAAAAAAKSLQSCPTLCSLWTAAHQAPLSTGFSRQEYWSGLPFKTFLNEQCTEVEESDRREGLEISSTKLEWSREHFMQGWAW